jgi:hypothetical protein
VPARTTAIRLLVALIAIAVASAALLAVLAVPVRMAGHFLPALAEK